MAGWAGSTSVGGASASRLAANGIGKQVPNKSKVELDFSRKGTPESGPWLRLSGHIMPCQSCLASHLDFLSVWRGQGMQARDTVSLHHSRGRGVMQTLQTAN